MAASLMLIGANAFAQASIGAGFVNSTDKTKYSGTTSTTNLSGFYVGGSYNIGISGGLCVAPGLYYTLVNKSDAEVITLGTIASAKADITEHYLSLPVMFNYGLQLADGVVGSVYAGPTLAYGIASNIKYTGSIVGFETDKTYDNYDYNYARFDVLLGGGVAVEFYDMVRFDVGYDYGMLNRYTGADDATRHRSQLHVGVAYMF